MSSTEVIYTYKSYTIPGPNELPIYFTRLITIMNQYKSGSAERRAAENELFPQLRDIGRYVLRGIFGTTSKCNAYICVTRHLCTCFACTGVKNQTPKLEQTYDLAILVLGIYLKKNMVQKNTCTPMFTITKT